MSPYIPITADHHATRVCKVIHKPVVLIAGISMRIVAAGYKCKVTGEASKALSGNKRNLAREFCVVAREFSSLRCLMNTLLSPDKN